MAETEKPNGISDPIRQELNLGQYGPEPGVLKGIRDSHNRQGVGSTPLPKLNVYSLMGWREGRLLMMTLQPDGCQRPALGPALMRLTWPKRPLEPSGGTTSRVEFNTRLS